MKRKILIIQQGMRSYRVPIFNLLHEKYDVTVAYTFGELPKSEMPILFRTVKLPIGYQLSKFVWHKGNMVDYCNQFDVVVAGGNIAWLKIAALPFYNKRKYKIIFWTIGVSADTQHNKRYDENTRFDKIRDFFYKKADALLFYCNYPVNKYTSRGFDSEKLFVANNTTFVNDISDIECKKDRILFVGTLYKSKGIWHLLNAYQSLLKLGRDLYDLDIIGTGEEFDNIKSWVESNNYGQKIHLLGAIYDDTIKMKHFSHALCCVSPCQAGLTVLESMGYGVPFVTTKNAITGGEIFNIKNGETGVLIDNPTDLMTVIQDICDNPHKFEEMGKKAMEFYKNNRTPKQMADGIAASISYVLSK